MTTKAVVFFNNVNTGIYLTNRKGRSVERPLNQY